MNLYDCPASPVNVNTILSFVPSNDSNEPCALLSHHDDGLFVYVIVISGSPITTSNPYPIQAGITYSQPSTTSVPLAASVVANITILFNPSL
ncbi:hypothetical protein RJI07_00010 [Mycoplasmatota bacterium WC30]